MKDKAKDRLLLDVVVREGVAVFKLFTSEDEALLVGWDTLCVLNLGLNVVDSIRRLHFESDGLAHDRLYEDLHASTQTEEVEGHFLLDVVGQGDFIRGHISRLSNDADDIH